MFRIFIRSVFKDTFNLNFIQNISHHLFSFFVSKGKVYALCTLFPINSQITISISYYMDTIRILLLLLFDEDEKWKMEIYITYKNLKSFKMSPIDLSSTHQMPIQTYIWWRINPFNIASISSQYVPKKCIKPNQYISHAKQAVKSVLYPILNLLKKNMKRITHNEEAVLWFYQ